MRYTIKKAIFAGCELRAVKESENLDELVEYANNHSFCYRNYVGIFDQNGCEILNICNGHK